MPYCLYLKKENFKFSSSHFTIFDATHAEALHGHNYRVGVKISFAEVQRDTEMKFDFNNFKKIVTQICETLDERILIPEKSPYLKIKDSTQHAGHTEVNYGKRHYCFPSEEVLKLPLANLTSEALARYLWTEFSYRFPKGFSKLVVSVTETSGQTAAYTQ